MLYESQTLVVADELFRIVGQQEIAELVVNVLLSGLDDAGRETLVEPLNRFHALLLFLLGEIVPIDVLCNTVNLFADDHDRVVQLLPLVIAHCSADA